MKEVTKIQRPNKKVSKQHLIIKLGSTFVASSLHC